MDKFELIIMTGLGLGWFQVMLGFSDHGFYTLGCMITVTLLAIVGYLKMIYLDKW